MRSDKHKPGSRPKEGKHDQKDVEKRPQPMGASKREQGEKSEGGDPRVRRRDEKTGQTLH